VAGVLGVVSGRRPSSCPVRWSNLLLTLWQQDLCIFYGRNASECNARCVEQQRSLHRYCCN